MIAQTTDQLEPIALWLDAGDVPARVVWRGIRYRVTDTPTPLAEDVPADFLTHPARRLSGWRFQATSCDGTNTVLVLDVVRQAAGGGWLLAATWQ